MEFARELLNPARKGPKLRPHSESVPCDEKPAKTAFLKIFPPVECAARYVDFERAPSLGQVEIHFGDNALELGPSEALRHE